MNISRVFDQNGTSRPCIIVEIYHSGRKASICNESCWASRRTILHGKDFTTGHYTQTAEPNVFIPAMLMGTIDFYHLVLLSLTLTLPGVTRPALSKTYLLHFLAHFSSSQDESCGDETIQAEQPETAFE